MVRGCALSQAHVSLLHFGIAQQLGRRPAQHDAPGFHHVATILLVDQNARAALGVADRGYVMETGRVVLCGPAAELLRNPEVQQAYMGL